MKKSIIFLLLIFTSFLTVNAQQTTNQQKATKIKIQCSGLKKDGQRCSRTVSFSISELKPNQKVLCWQHNPGYIPKSKRKKIYKLDSLIVKDNF